MAKENKELESDSQNDSGDDKSNDDKSSNESENSQSSSEDTKAELEKAKEREKELFGRAKSAESKLKKLQSALEEKDDSQQSSGDDKSDDNKSNDESHDEWRERVEFQVNNPDINKDDVALISQLKRSNESISDAYERKEVKEYLDFQRKKRSSEEKPIDSSPPGTPPEVDNIADMDRDEHKKLDQQSVKQNQERYANI